MPTLIEMAAELTGSIPGLSNLFARKYINRALQEIKRDYLWSWNIAEGVLIIPGAITSGTVTITQYANTVTFDATAIAVLATLPAPTPITTLQFRVPSSGPIYNITAYNSGTGVATLDRLYTEPSGTAQQFTVYKIYFGPPSTNGTTPNTDFLRYLSILNPINGYAIQGKRLYMTRAELNRRDPLRGAQGLPYYVATYKPDAQGIMQYELWPQCPSSLTLLCNYERQHVELQPGDSLPNQCPAPLVQYRAFEYCYRWAMQNAARIPELKGVDWRFALGDVQAKYAKELVTAKKNDKEILLQIFRPGSGWTLDFQGPIDSNFMQSHGVAAF